MKTSFEVISTLKTPILDVGGLILRMEAAIDSANTNAENRLSSETDAHLLGNMAALHSLLLPIRYNMVEITETEIDTIDEVFGRFSAAREKLWEKVNLPQKP